MSGMQRYASWIDRHAVLVLLISLAVAAGGGALAIRLPLASDLSNLLPGSEPSVRDLKRIQARARPFGTVQLAVEAADPAVAARASDALAARIAGGPGRAPVIDPALIASFSRDDGPRDRYAWQHRFLFADLADLVAARDALVARMDRARLAANPLYIDLDDDEPAESDRLEQLEQKLAELEARALRPPPRASADGRMHVLVLQTTFAASDTGRGGALIAALERAIAEVRAELPGVTVGLTGNVVMSLHEHDSVLEGMALSLGLTVLLCGIALVGYYRSGRIVVAMLLALGVGVAATFAIAWVAIGNLNVMTAFLFAIVVGNGINASLILVARYLEDRRAGLPHDEALVQAMRGAAPGTLGAAATAAIAYASLLVTDFRGFREFGAIAGVGMVATWVTTFTTLPAMIAVLARRGRLRAKSPPALGEWLARLLPERRLGGALWGAAALTAAAVVITVVYIAGDPFTRDWRDLQSSTPAIQRAHELNGRIRAALGRTDLTSQAYQLVVAVEDRADAGPLVARLRAANEVMPAPLRWMQDAFSLDDLIPARQREKLAVLAEIRALLDRPELQATLSDADRARLAKVRPPDTIPLVTDADVPPELAWPFIERDGSRGKLVIVRGAARLDSFDVDDRLEFAAIARSLELPPGSLLASESLVVADIIEVMERDAPRMIAFALLGSILAVGLFVGYRRHGAVTLACGLAGVAVMIAACAAVGLRVHFLDLIALPITIGIGIDYAVNVAVRDRQDGERGVAHVLRTTGSAVLLCSFTTAVGYGTLLLSANGGIRAFGLAALIGELACVGVALIAAPAALALLRRRRGG